MDQDVLVLLQAQLSDLEQYELSPESVAVLRDRVGSRLVGTTFEDRRFIIEAVGAQVITSGYRTWELELKLPRTDPAEPQIAIISPQTPSRKLCI